MVETLKSLAFKAGLDISPADVGGGSLENPSTPLSRVFDTQPSFTGRSVTVSSSLTVAAVWACVRIIAGTVAKTPTKVYRRTKAGKEEATDHYLYSLLCGSANPHMTAFRFFRLMQAWVLLWGNAYAEIEINGRGQITALWPWRPDRVRVVQMGNGELSYIYDRGDGNISPAVGQHRMLHIRGLELDGMMGMSPIQQARQSIGLAMAAEEYGARFFGNNGRPGMVLEHPGALSETAIKNLKESWEQVHKGLQGAHRVGILEEGMKLHEVGIPPEDAQFLQTRQHQVIDVCRWYGVQPHKIAELTRATNNNIEHQGLEFVQDTMEDHFCNWEAEISHALLSEREAKTVFACFDRGKLLRGDFKSRAEGLAILRQNGFINSDEGREDLGYNPIADGAGQKYIVQLNMQELDQVGENAEAAETPAEEGKQDE